ncbi:putative holin-like toxin [Paenibacillus popilliae]|nr:putative holin-like toxin [Paenibacillus popilliae]
MEIKDALTLMIEFSLLIVALLTLIFTVVIALLNQKK